MTATAIKFPVNATGTEEVSDGWGGSLTVTTFTVKGRLEMSKDIRAIFIALTKVKGVEGFNFRSYGAEGGGEVTLTWYVGRDGQVNPDWVSITQKQIDAFIETVLDILANVNTNKYPELKGSGVEPHVFVESLKVATEFDGERNGPLSNWDGRR